MFIYSVFWLESATTAMQSLWNLFNDTVTSISLIFCMWVCACERDVPFSPVFVSLWIHFLYFTISGLFRFFFFLMQSHFSLFKKKKKVPSTTPVLWNVSLLLVAFWSLEVLVFVQNCFSLPFFVFCNCQPATMSVLMQNVWTLRRRILFCTR